LADICWTDDKKSHLKHVLRACKVQISDFKFSKVMQQHIKDVVGNLIRVLGNLVLFAAVKEFLQIDQELTKL